MARHEINWDLRWSREALAEYGISSRDEARRLIHQAAEDCSICAGCFKPLAAGQSVTVRVFELGSRRNSQLVRAPVCLVCTLTALKPWPFKWHRDHPTYDGADWSRTRCRGCGRPLRIHGRSYAAQACCEVCRRQDRNHRNAVRRRVEHAPVICIECREPFVPKRTDAVTCSNRCRQAQHRKRLA
jgi:hypothetical protein